MPIHSGKTRPGTPHAPPAMRVGASMAKVRRKNAAN
jgi:hypothetical protein